MSANAHSAATPSAMLLACLLYPVGPAAIILMPMIVGGLIDSYQFSEQQAGNIAALEGLGLMLASVVAAAWIRRVSWVKALMVAFLANAALNALSANMDGYVPLLILRCLTGFAGGSVFAVTVAALGDQREPDRAFGFAQAMQGVMMLGGFLAAPWLVQRWGVGALYYMLAGASLLLLLPLRRFPVAGRLRAAVADTASQAGHAGLIWLGLFASVMFFVNFFGFWAFVERIGQAGGLPVETVALALGISQVMAIVGALAAAWASDRYGRYLPLLIVFIGQAAALFAVLGDFGATAFFFSTGLFQALFIVGVSYQMGAIAKLDIHGRYLVTMTAAQGLGAALGPALAASMIREGGDYSLIMPMAALLCLFGTLMFLFIIRRSAKIDAGGTA
ncbi:MAG: MFS transporter [Gammaproteobacteria bacterium]|nr:MFS transporter [Gammaproteobacteria bacterium]